MESKKITKEMTINEVIRTYPKTVEVFKKFEVDSCCCGAHSIEFVCRHHNIDTQILVDSLNIINNPKKEG